MGWLDSFWSNEPDQLANLDPKLRAYLKRVPSEQVKHPTVSASSRPSTLSIQPQTAQRSAPQQQTAAPAEVAHQSSHVPTESLFQDGRYAHLWKTYRSQAEIEGEQKSEDEKITELLGAYKDRNRIINRDAQENCALEQGKYRDCMMEGSWRAKMTLCATEARHFERCFATQARLMKALGYLSTPGTPVEVEEDMRMHADALWLRMVEQEEAVEKAKADGTPIPDFLPVIRVSSNIQKSGDGAAATEKDLSDYRWAKEERRRQALEKLPEADRPIEEAALEADKKVAHQTWLALDALREEYRVERRARLARGEGTLGDKFKSMFEWGK